MSLLQFLARCCSKLLQMAADGLNHIYDSVMSNFPFFSEWKAVTFAVPQEIGPNMLSVFR